MYATYSDGPKKPGEITEVKKIVRKGLDYNLGTLTVDSINIVYSKNFVFYTLTDEIHRDERKAIIANEKANLADKAEHMKRLYAEDDDLTSFTSLDCEEFIEYD